MVFSVKALVYFASDPNVCWRVNFLKLNIRHVVSSKDEAKVITETDAKKLILKLRLSSGSHCVSWEKKLSTSKLRLQWWNDTKNLRHFICKFFHIFISYGLAILINSTGISFPTDLRSGNRIPTLGKVKKFLPAALRALGRNFFDLPLGGNSIPTPQIRRECVILARLKMGFTCLILKFKNDSFCTVHYKTKCTGLLKIPIFYLESH